MSQAQVSNPIPKNTTTINDIVSSQDTSTYNQTKKLERRRLSSKNNEMNQDLNRSNYEPYNDGGLSSGYESSNKRGRKKIKSVSKHRNIRSRKGLSAHGVKFKVATNDFDPDSVNDGLNEIDILLDQLETKIPEDVYETDDFEVDEMMKVNRHLRDKIGEISQFVASAITKARTLKRQIITHRDKPHDPEVAKKEAEIKNYQVKVMKCKKYIKSLNMRLENSSDFERINTEKGKEKMLDKEISELKSQK